MASKYRNITISVSNDELNALEDYLMVELTPEKRKKYHRKALSIWGRLVKEWDKPEKKKVKVKSKKKKSNWTPSMLDGEEDGYHADWKQ